MENNILYITWQPLKWNLQDKWKIVSLKNTWCWELEANSIQDGLHMEPAGENSVVELWLAAATPAGKMGDDDCLPRFKAILTKITHL